MFSMCRSCYEFVDVDDLTQECPRCGGPLRPDALMTLKKFAEHGNDPTYGGVPLPQAQRAADEIVRAHEELLKSNHDS